MTEKEAYDQAIYAIANFGYRSQSLAEAEIVLRSHIALMSDEKQGGKPNGPIHWALLMVILHKLIEQKDIWTAKEKAPKSVFWVPYVIK